MKKYHIKPSYKKPSHKRGVGLWIMLLLIWGPVSTKAQVNSWTMTRQLFDRDCLDYCLEGTCVFLRCGLTGCSINTVPKVSHNRPDLLISAVSQPGEEPWVEARATVVHFASQLGGTMLERMLGFFMGGGGDEPNSDRDLSSTLKFKDVHIIGTPMASMDFEHMCRSHTDAFKPHLITESSFVGWRMGMERFLPQSYVPGFREVGQWPSYTWGPIYPRNGILNQKDDAKAAGVMARRGLSVVLEGGMSHVYQSFPGNNGADNPWQRLHPGVGRCEAAPGYTNDVSWTRDNLSDDGMNSWLYWHRYTCCLGGRGRKIAEVNFGPICI